MVKCLINSAMVVSVLSCSIANASDNALIDNKEKITRNGVSIYLEPNSPNKQDYLNGKFDKSLELMKKAYKANKNNKTMRASAPPVTEVQILEVESTQGGYEYVLGKSITDQDHGGSYFVVSTGVTGYGGGSYDRAKFAGNDAVQLSSDGIDLTGDNIIDGWLDIWDISKPANISGPFEFTSRSINAPGNSMSTRIQIR
ncbi:DUF4879 domain-containing protein [Campylobacter sp. MIT 12-5580]|uniref:DUF4879 domain-containing protein n=1 Tax=Campylobacter sp. MIT 12-5580 TaxID=2040651 RepID=UPI001484EB9A|nr:DUF4879 domain-containing protein [Campylobacter sp. MIT 12-5580]